MSQTKYFRLPRWIILVVDIAIVFFSLTLAYLLRFNFDIPQDEIQDFYKAYPTVLGIRLFSFFITKVYRGIIRYTSSSDIIRISSVLLVGTMVMFILNFITFAINKAYITPTSVLLIEFISTSLLMIVLRIVAKMLYFEFRFSKKPKLDVIIYGAGELGVIAKRTLDRDRAAKYNIVAFVDHHKKRINTRIEGIKVYSPEKLNNLVDDNHVSHLIISSNSIEKSQKNKLIEECLNHDITVRDVPPIENWINGELSFNQIKHVKIEDLLGRDEIEIDLNKIGEQVNNKVILVTGASGSIGSEICRQLLKFKPKKLIMFDQAESPMFELNVELLSTYSKVNWEVVVGDIRNKERLENTFINFNPQMVFHAAAYKHVPLMENNPCEAVETNVGGTKILADLSVKYSIEKFVFISTDKAVNPTNVMGASKRTAEIYVQSLNKVSKTKFITTRFGNVLGSNGSVIPVFKKQIDRGGPVTVTHPEITRFFMTIPEACKLVLEAGTIGVGGEIFVFDMGESVKILDLAKKMIQLSGLQLGIDIQITFAGLRPGEKIKEELFSDKEMMLTTHNSKILIAKVREYTFDEVLPIINNLLHLAKKQNNNNLIAGVKALIPEYKSNNSEYSSLDKQTIKE